MVKLCIDPGHGGTDTGACGQNGLKEAGVNLAISQYLANYLLDLGVDILLTRDTDVYVGLNDRCEISNNWGSDYFVSVHQNSDGPSACGIETLYVSNAGLDLAIPVQDNMITATGDVDRGVKKRTDLAVLNGTNCPAILTESGFISCPETEAKLATSEYQRTIAAAISRGLAIALDLRML
jgi:N-acetylmuramoyl-L-alanine amidase